ncbi:MAG: hypothetical protein JO354_07025 [Verrucomicrobia bacterium]|nr:hypothetical protein [Verrucomicrobiota bacterium]
MHKLTCAFIFAAALLVRNVLGAPGDLYQADYASGTVYRYTPAGAKSAFASGLGSPAGLAFDPAGNLFVANNGGSIIKITPAGTQSIFAAGLNSPYGLAFDVNGNLYEADEGSGTIFKFTPGGTKTVFASGLSGPAGLAFDNSGNLYAGNFTAGRIDRITPAGVRTTFATGLSYPDALFFTPFGTLLECDSGSGNVFSFTTAGARTTIASGFTQNAGVLMDQNHNLFVTQNSAGNIIEITSTGARVTFAAGLANPQYLAIERPTGALANISTRAYVGTGDEVLIAGFIIDGTAPKPVLVRGLGPTLSHFGVVSPLQDPTLELHNSTGVIAANDDWQSAPNAGQIPPNLRPPDPRESAILTTLQPASYTAILAGKNNSTGIALVEVYDLNTGVAAELANISSRGLVQPGQNVMIGGFVNTGGNGTTQVLVRALGPTLSHFGVSNPLPDPVLQLFDSNGTLVASNDNWQTTQADLIEGTGLAPPNPLESAIIATLPDAPHTAIVSGKNGASGVALVEVYKLQ